ncbi:Probable magnesium transporter NIPA7 [Linum grandiflorum]
MVGWHGYHDCWGGCKFRGLCLCSCRSSDSSWGTKYNYQVVSIKAIGTAIKLTLDGINQITYPQTWFFLTVAAICVITQLNYLNKALDTFNAAIVSPVYYVMFTTLTIAASAIMFKDWAGQDASSIASEICGFITVLSGTIILHSTRDQEPPPPRGTVSWYVRDDSFKNLDGEHLLNILETEEQ